jgi:hypothetical protein
LLTAMIGDPSGKSVTSSFVGWAPSPLREADHSFGRAQIAASSGEGIQLPTRRRSMNDIRELNTDELTTVYGGATSMTNPLPNPQPNPWDRLVNWFKGIFH